MSTGTRWLFESPLREVEWENVSRCPPAGQIIRFVISRFNRYNQTVPSSERDKLDAIARTDRAQLPARLSAHPKRAAGGHADRDPLRERREPGFERKISAQRAETVAAAIRAAVGDGAITRQVRFDLVPLGS